MPDLSLTFTELPPGLNGRNGLIRLHWKDRQALLARWRILVLEAIGTATGTCSTPITFAPTHPCTVEVLRVDRRMMDWDNLGASLKPVLDGLVHAGVLSDDGPAVVTHLTMRQAKPMRGQASCLYVKLTALPETPRT